MLLYGYVILLMLLGAFSAKALYKVSGKKEFEVYPHLFFLGIELALISAALD